MITIRPEQPEDIEAIRHINQDAFPSDAEADLVDALRKQVDTYISLVAERDKVIVGHIMFSPVTLKGEESYIRMAGLAPMAVLSGYQNQGIGSALVKEGLQVCEEQGYQVIVVLGHPNFYPRFGFVPSVRFGLRSEYDVPDEVFMVREARAGLLEGLNGVFKYDDCFNSL